MHILFLNPYHGGSHAAFATSYQAASRHTITLLSLPTAGGWRWRMRGGAVSLARLAREQHITPDLIFTTDMLDAATFRALTRDIFPPHIPLVAYFHENQLTYPLPTGRSRDLSFAWINYTTALAADQVLFNTHFHYQWFLDALPDLLGRYHDYRERETIPAIHEKVTILPSGVDLARLEQSPDKSDQGSYLREACSRRDPPIILWSSRWDYDKQPHVFFDALEALDQRGIAFRLIVAGEAVDPNTPAFVAARERWANHLIHWGYPASLAEYRDILHCADIVVSTAIQETFGMGLLEALYCGCIPILPRRLSYPELIPADYHQWCLYDSFDDLVDRLAYTIQQCDMFRRIDWRAIAAPYDWSQMRDRYDDLLETFVAGEEG